MSDREKVVKALEYCSNGCSPSCPYLNVDCCYDLLSADALTLLKEQEAKNVVNMTLSKNYSLIASCPKCNVLLTRVEHKNYCGYCGQAVKWDE